MGVSFFKCKKLPVFLYFSCLHKLKEDRFISSPHPKPDKVSLEEKPRVNCDTETVILKSSLKKNGCSDYIGVEKRNVKWMDLVGKELVEIREFEPM
ncbi:hypothetical protein FCM35_KLT10220 [Carex littledalei]|uniref:Uncharacterized protein n=1 Tax=Carex littledalei TaxID=544730 RepID=A0A833QLY6_9POAL|nr:hypothetical protein FCM35_KLT10220 [Carex littledalei]